MGRSASKRGDGQTVGALGVLYKNTFKQDDSITAPDTYMVGETVCYEQKFDPAPLSPLFCAGMGPPGDEPIKRAQDRDALHARP
ncbi:hypothetical protein [Antarctobacter jejuensis]|uniref:hypothetical protein n=1 Tax=Antarctobacter jejuensis TaxID=1439938 RepID=UPI003FD4BBE7